MPGVSKTDVLQKDNLLEGRSLQVRARRGAGDGGGVGHRGRLLPPLLPRTDPWVCNPPSSSTTKISPTLSTSWQKNI